MPQSRPRCEGEPGTLWSPVLLHTWKALIALYETGATFEFRNISGNDFPENEAAFLAHWPIGKFPLLVDDGVPVMESSVIVEHVAPALIPADPAAAREVRMLDRIFDNHVMTPVQAVVSEHIPLVTPVPDAGRIARAKEALDKAYSWLDVRLAERTWAAGDAFTLADCAGAPALFYADWVHRIPVRFETLTAYRARALARPSVSRCVEEARPYRHFFPWARPTGIDGVGRSGECGLLRRARFMAPTGKGPNRGTVLACKGRKHDSRSLAVDPASSYRPIMALGFCSPL